VLSEIITMHMLYRGAQNIMYKARTSNMKIATQTLFHMEIKFLHTDRHYIVL